STEVVAVVARGLDEAETLMNRLEATRSVERVEGVPGYLPDRQREKLQTLAKLAPVVDTPSAGARAPDVISKGDLVDALEGLVDTLVDTHFEAVRANADEASYLEPLITSMKAFKKRVASLNEAEATERLGALQRDVLALQDRALSALRKASSGAVLDAPTLLQLLPEGIRTRMANGDRYAVYAYPRQPLRDEAVMHAFVHDVQAVSSEATGFPVSHYQNIATLKQSFRQAGIVTLFAVLFLLLVDFRAISRTLLAMVPLSMGLSVAWGGMALLDMAYHPANVIAFPLIIGIGIDAGVHILHRYRQEGSAQIAAVVRHTGRAVMMSTGTTMIGFGSLGLARHNGMSEMGLVLLMGIAASLFGATIILPAILALFSREDRAETTPGT
ncbi:MAG: MMPL family transporter, partial [Myxococcota bacterium]|nr:MMPL family transporter [Myxococcota bacterium]